MHVDASTDALSDAGSIPAASTIFSLSTSGQNRPNSGQSSSQSGQSQEVAKEACVEEGTENTSRQTNSGHAPNTIRTQQEHNPLRSKDPTPRDLKLLLETWGRLPEAVREGILAMVRQYADQDGQH